MKSLLSHRGNYDIFAVGVVENWLSVNWVEIIAALVSITYVILTIREIIWLWLFGFLSAILYAWVYAHSGFYAGMALQGYYAVISIYGWMHWSRASAAQSSEKTLPVVRATRRQLFVLISLWLLLWMAIGIFLKEFTDSTIPFPDALTASGGIVATWMLARKILEQWLFWIFIDSVSIVLYLWQGLYATTALFAVYIIMAVIGYRQWKKTWKASL
ncbi:MAG: nicotinamide riboside transporter PnuC [Bacteroidales bacterium]|jgi:nicotinamide mononucleotide transporter